MNDLFRSVPETEGINWCSVKDTLMYFSGNVVTLSDSLKTVGRNSRFSIAYNILRCTFFLYRYDRIVLNVGWNKVFTTRSKSVEVRSVASGVIEWNCSYASVAIRTTSNSNVKTTGFAA